MGKLMQHVWMLVEELRAVNMNLEMVIDNWWREQGWGQ